MSTLKYLDPRTGRYEPVAPAHAHIDTDDRIGALEEASSGHVLRAGDEVTGALRPAGAGTIASGGITRPWSTLYAEKISLLDYVDGGHIGFPATQNPSSGANVLDDYEEGTWTPALWCSAAPSGIVGYGTRFGYYTKIGRLVTLWWYVQAQRGSLAGYNLIVTGFPFAADAITYQSSASYWVWNATAWATVAGTPIYIPSGANWAYLLYHTDSGASPGYIGPANLVTSGPTDFMCVTSYRASA